VKRGKNFSHSKIKGKKGKNIQKIPFVTEKNGKTTLTKRLPLYIMYKYYCVNNKEYGF